MSPLGASSDPTIAIDLAALDSVGSIAFALKTTCAITCSLLQTHLLLSEGAKSRSKRIALWPVVVVLVTKLWLGYRFQAPEHNVLNYVFAMGYIYLLVKSTEWAFTTSVPIRTARPAARRMRRGAQDGPCRDSPRVRKINERGGRMDAVVLAFSMRMDDWEHIGVSPSFPQLARSRCGDIDSEADTGDILSQIEDESHPTPNAVPSISPSSSAGTRPRSVRFAAGRHHSLSLLVHYVILDMIVQGAAIFAADTLGDPTGGEDVLPQAETRLVSWLYTLLKVRNEEPAARLLRASLQMARYLFRSSVHCLTALMIYSAVCFTHHAAALIGIYVIGQDAWDWERKVMDRPWMAESGVNFWGRRWHRLFRHIFTLPSAALGLDPSKSSHRILTTILAFTASALIHELALLTMIGRLSPGLVMTKFFLLAGLGVICEMTFKRVTGRRVEGCMGRIWFWAWTMKICAPAMEIFLNAGIGGTKLYPPWLSIIRGISALAHAAPGPSLSIDREGNSDVVPFWITGLSMLGIVLILPPMIRYPWIGPYEKLASIWQRQGWFDLGKADAR